MRQIRLFSHNIFNIFRHVPTAVLVVIGLLGIGILFFHEPLFSGGLVNATDVLTQQYFWNVFIKDNLFSDPSFQTWMPYVNAGTPFGGGLNMLFRPISLLTLLFLPVHVAINYEIVLYLLLMGISMFFYMRELNVSYIGSFLAGLFIMLNGQIVTLINAGHVNKLGTIAFTPLVFWALERALKQKTLKAFVLTGVMLAVQFWETHIQISFYVCIAVGIYFLIRVGLEFKQKRNAQQISRLMLFALLMVLVFLLLSAVEFLPWISFAQVSDRSEGVDYEFATSWSMPPEELVSYVIPGFFGYRRLNYIDSSDMLPYWGRMPFTQTGHYFGLLPLLFLLLAVCFVRNKHVLTLSIIATLVLLLGMGKYFPPYKLLYDSLPGFNKFRVPQMILFLFAFAGSALAGLGAEWIFSDWSKEKETRLRFFLLVGVALLILISLFAALFPLLESSLLTRFSDALLRKGATQDVAQLRLEAISRETAKFCFFFGASIFTLGLRVTRVRKRWLLVILLLVYLIDIGLFNNKYIDTIPLEGSHYIAENDAIRYCKENPGLYRILPMANEPATYNIPNKHVYHKLASVSGYEAVGVQYYNEYLRQMALGTALVDLLNIKYIILPKNVELDGEAVEVGKVVGPYKVVMDSDAVLLENLNVLPRAYAVHTAVVSHSKEETFGMLLHQNFDPRELVVLEEDHQAALSQDPAPSSQSSVEITQYVTRTLSMNVSMADDGFLVLSEKFYPGWKAYVDGRETKIYKANHTLQAVAVPQGEHDIEFLFHPRQYWIGFWITCISLLAVILSFFKTSKTQGTVPTGTKNTHVRSFRTSDFVSRMNVSVFFTRVPPFLIRTLVYVAFTALLVAAFLNIQYGIDHLSMIAVFSADEAFAVQLVTQNLQQDKLDPQGFYNYGYLYHSLVFYTAKFLKSLDYRVDERVLAYVFRWISLASYGLLLFLGYGLTKLLTKDRVFSLCATLFLASVPGVYSWGQQTHPDMLQAMLVTAAAYVACRRPDGAHLTGATVLAALAFSTKYTGMFVFPFVFMPYCLFEFTRKRRNSESFNLRDWGKMLSVIFSMSLVFLIVWLLVNPTVLHHFGDLVEDLKFEKRHVAWGDGQAESKNPLLWFALLFRQFGTAGSVLLLLGAGLLIWNGGKAVSHRAIRLGASSVERSLLMLFSFSMTGLVYLMLQVNLRKDRYILHIIPVLVVLGFAGLYRYVDKSAILRKGKILLSLVLLVTALPLGLSAIQEQHEASHKYEHQYLKATAWIEQHYPPDIRILADNYSYQSPRLSQFMHVWGVDREAIEYVQPQLIMINKMLSGRWSWKRSGTTFADLDFEFGPYEAKRETVQAFHLELFAAESPYLVVYEDTDIVILENARQSP